MGAFLASKNQLLNIQLPTNKTLTLCGGVLALWVGYILHDASQTPEERAAEARNRRMEEPRLLDGNDNHKWRREMMERERAFDEREKKMFDDASKLQRFMLK